MTQFKSLFMDKRFGMQFIGFIRCGLKGGALAFCAKYT